MILGEISFIKGPWTSGQKFGPEFHIYIPNSHEYKTMSFNLKEYLTENKLTPTSRLSRVRRPGGSYLLQEGGIRDLYRSEDDEVYNNMRQALGRERPNFRYEEGPGVKDLAGLTEKVRRLIQSYLQSPLQTSHTYATGDPKVFEIKWLPWEDQEVSCLARILKIEEPDLERHWTKVLEVKLFDIKTQVKKNLD